MRRAFVLLLGVCVFFSSVVPAQIVPPRPSVEIPQIYFDRIAQDKTAFQFQKAWFERTRRARETRERFLREEWRPGMSLASLPEAIRQAMTVSGTVEVPVFMAKFSNTGADPYPVSQLQTKLFAAPPALSMTALYDEMSYGNVNLTGTVYDWFEVSEDDLFYESGCNGLCGGAKTGQLILEVLEANDPSVDFGVYDNDGPDGVPNSGDDDGFVDFIAVVQPETGGECGGANMWSHRWVVAGWPEFDGAWTTNDPRTGGGFIQVWDYTIQPALGSANGCGTGVIEIGVFCHEFGHAFGLPDLYDTGGGTGIGHWGLMGSGNWNTPPNPAHMSAWSKMELGWIIPTEVGPTAQPYAIDNVELNSEAYQLNVMEEKFRRDDFFPIGGSYSLHCGLNTAEATARGWQGGAGYGNAWDESIRCDFTYDGGDPVTLEYDYQYHTEAGYDFAYVKIDVNGTVTTLRTYDDMDAGHDVVNLTPYLSGSGAAGYQLIAQFVADEGWSDEDGEFNSSVLGAFKLDNISVVGGGEDYLADFEQNDNGWYYDFTENPTKEFFLVENRNTAGQFDQSLHAEGLAIWHVEQYVMAPGGFGNTGGENNTNIRGMILEEADAEFHLQFSMNRGDAGDVYPGSSNNTMFNNSSVPNSTSHNTLPTRVLVEDIGGPGAQMTATMRGGHFPPTVSSITPRFWYSDSLITITQLAGTSILHGATFLLRDSGMNEFPAETAKWIGKTMLTGVLDLTGMASGDYDVVVRNPDGQEAVLENGFQVRNIVPVFVQMFDARATRSGVELRWDVLADEPVKGFKIARREAGRSLEEEIQGAQLIGRDTRMFTDDKVRPATNYEYVLIVVLSDGAEQRSQTIRVKSVGYTLVLMQNHPNPFNPVTRIGYSLPERTHVTLVVYDPAGKRVTTLVNEMRNAGTNEVTWGGRNSAGEPVSSGVYFYRLKVGNRLLTRKMLLLK